MRLLIGLVAAAGVAGLTGCAAYDDAYATNGVVYGTTTYSTAPAYGYYSYNTAPVYPAYPAYPAYPRTYRDRDGDGVANLYDRRPDDPTRN